MKHTKLLIVLVAALLMVVWGCERKVTNEIIQESNGLAGAESCMKCHGDGDLALVAAQKQWERSKHGEGATANIDANAGEGDCERCHTAEGFLAYITDTPFDSSHYSSIGCFTCHAPHTTGTLALRVTEAVTLENGVTFNHGEANLCTTCHHSRRNVNTYVADSVKLSSRFGPHHGPQGDLLTGTGGYEYATYTYTNSAHTNSAANGCIDCHMAPSIGLELGGHSWNMVVSADGAEELELVGCNNVNCHNGALEDFNYKLKQDTVLAFLDSLGEALLAADLVDSSFAPKANKIVKHRDSSGAVYNYTFIKEDRSEGVHNTAYALGLLKSAFNFIKYDDPNGAVGAPRKNNELVSAH